MIITLKEKEYNCMVKVAMSIIEQGQEVDKMLGVPVIPIIAKEITAKDIKAFNAKYYGIASISVKTDFETTIKIVLNPKFVGDVCSTSGNFLLTVFESLKFTIRQFQLLNMVVVNPIIDKWTRVILKNKLR